MQKLLVRMPGSITNDDVIVSILPARVNDEVPVRRHGVQTGFAVQYRTYSLENHNKQRP